jgi:hypothetical protein
MPGHQRNKKMVLTGFLPVLTSLREKTFCRTLNCLFYRLLRALIGGQAYERASSGNVIDCPPDVCRPRASLTPTTDRYSIH